MVSEHEKEIKAREEFAQQQAADRQAIFQKRESLHRLFPEKYAPDVSVFTDGKVETMFKLTYEQADNLARLNEGARSLAQVSGPALSSHDSIMWQTAFPGHDPRLNRR
jgi:hypothetical protein